MSAGIRLDSVDPAHEAPVHGGMLDVSGLPSFAFGHRSLMWWSTLGMIVIEGTVFALTIASYFYLNSHATKWPPSTAAPDLMWGSLNITIMLASALPNHWLRQAGEAGDLRRMRLWFVVCSLSSLIILGVRAMEFTTLNVRWDTDAYGSVVWMLLALHTVHLLTDAYDTVVLTVLMFTGPLEGQRRVDTSETAQYWYFVVLAWLPIYLVIYWTPRWH